MKALDKDEDIELLIKDNELVLLQYGADACKPCHAITHRLDEWQKEHPEVFMRYIDIQTHTELSSQRNIMTVPTIVVYAEGRLAIRKSGYFSLDEVLMRLDEYIEFMK